MQHILFEVKKTDKVKALKFLSAFSSEAIYQIEEKDKIFLGGFFLNLPKDLPLFLLKYSLLELEIDWQKQWNDFSPINQNNLFDLQLSEYGHHKHVVLKPGPGFGDLSHPTTKLCLKHMAKFCPKNEVIDFGCGSGILSVAAWAFNAFKVISLDIDKEAILHTQENLVLNGFPSEYVFSSFPQQPHSNPLICVINMTFGEQKVALRQLDLFPTRTKFLSSGILNDQVDRYLSWSKSMGLDLQLLDQLQGWSIFEGCFDQEGRE